MKPLSFSGCFPWLAAGLLAAAMPARAPAQVQSIVINEFVADNKDGLQDEDGAASDWLELYNPTSAPVPLAGAVLTDDAAELTKWPLPEVSVPARGYLVIFASSKDRRNPAAPLHTNFALSKNGEFLALVWQGQVVSGFAPSFPAQEEDVSYGSRVDGSSDLVFMRQPTPGAPNDPASGLPEPVGIDPPGRTFSVPFNATLTAERPDAVIHYTMDGTVPTAASPVYAGPLPITATTRLRAMARAGGTSSAVTSASWVRLAPDLAGYSSPLPLMVIENFNGGPVPAKGLNAQQVAAQSAAWLIQERRGTTADWSDVPQLYGEIGIRGRGHFSSTWSKK